MLSEEEWLRRLQPEDYRALCPLIWNHVNPYGEIQLNLEERLAIDAA